MTDKKTAPTDEDRRLAHEWAKSVESNTRSWTARILAAARVILDAVPALPNLSDMTHAERRECQWMRCDVAGLEGDWLIIDPFDDESHAHVVDRLGDARVLPTHHVTPRPDLARMEWTGNKKPDPAPTAQEDYPPRDQLTLGGKWADITKLEEALTQKGEAADQAIVLDDTGEVYVWEADDGGRWMARYPVQRCGPFRLILNDQEADQ